MSYPHESDSDPEPEANDSDPGGTKYYESDPEAEAEAERRLTARDKRRLAARIKANANAEAKLKAWCDAAEEALTTAQAAFDAAEAAYLSDPRKKEDKKDLQQIAYDAESVLIRAEAHAQTAREIYRKSL